MPRSEDPFAGWDEAARRRATILVTTLELAVPLWIMQLQGLPVERRLARGRACAQVVAEKGDVLQFGGKKGAAAAAFNALAEGLAVLAFQPGGVTFMGEHWEVPGAGDPPAGFEIPSPPPPGSARRAIR